MAGLVVGGIRLFEDRVTGDGQGVGAAGFVGVVAGIADRWIDAGRRVAVDVLLR
jgi:hypothetical protein